MYIVLYSSRAVGLDWNCCVFLFQRVMRDFTDLTVFISVSVYMLRPVIRRRGNVSVCLDTQASFVTKVGIYFTYSSNLLQIYQLCINNPLNMYISFLGDF